MTCKRDFIRMCVGADLTALCAQCMGGANERSGAAAKIVYFDIWHIPIYEKRFAFAA